ncbi:aromatic ring-hydroxylating dioxygenase subunit alpha [Lusitaniella coriacea LEGE 07157]|uniref:Aromatic ring-hydroxylating dioxygenase subunit alpha n=1 Tax=Lusitaniella coriacea LEGE 07157 TaxID=945747 RepID=A0A8J7E0I1_9CYAN|nr:aromatic ring-hydroxylating dioxygenase subunit alpha [Lusitaniella coriacea]MBE9118362.1 aromatic ring-hydroxylating dioxygenase subunit alpha [Lusitaniella coriacea LEGE 07157]
MQLQDRKFTDVRTCGINPNHWYVVARSTEVRDRPIGIVLWKQAIVLFRDRAGKIHALEDRCPHRQVKLSEGKVAENAIECAYHGWQFGAEGNCVTVPYLGEKQKLPNCTIRDYPVRECNGFIWVFPGEGNSEDISPLDIPEWEHLNYIATVSTVDCPGHYSFLIENLMDMYHGHLHDNYQAWASAKLEKIEEARDRVDVRYEAQSYYRIDKIWSISQLFFPALRRLHPEPLDVSYVYPNWVSRLGDDFKIYCLFCPVSETQTRAYLLHFTSLNAFWRLHKLPVGFRRWVKNSLFGSAQKLLDGLVRQDVAMIEQEQQAYLQNPQRRTYELNPAIFSVQQLIRQQVEEGKYEKISNIS